MVSKFRWGTWLQFPTWLLTITGKITSCTLPIILTKYNVKEDSEWNGNLTTKSFTIE